MTIEEVKKFMEENKSNEELKSFLQGLVSVEGVQKFLSENEEGKRFLDSERDKHLSKGLETWKSNNLQKEVDKRVLELYPKETPEKKQLRELNVKIEKMESEKQREVLKNKALTLAAEKKLPINKIVDLLIADDEETTVSNIGKFEDIFGASVQTAVDHFINKARVIITGYCNIDILPEHYDTVIAQYAAYLYKNRDSEGLLKKTEGEKSVIFEGDIPYTIRLQLPLPRIRVVG